MTEEKTAAGVLTDKLRLFFERGNAKSIEYDEESKRYWITEPWGDPSVEFGIDEGDENTITLLNKIRLPERYSAIFHEDTKQIEVIYTVFPPFAGNDIRDRKFEFIHAGKKFFCAFQGSSETLLKIARHVRQKEGHGLTNFRNLMDFNLYIQAKEGADGTQGLDLEDLAPTSFWIGPVEWNDDEVLDLIHNLNFYMSYYDNATPVVLIHTPDAESRPFKGVDRFPFGDFPGIIRSSGIDRNLLHFWQAARTGDPARRFLYNYQILEYASHAMVEDEISKAITKMLSSPDAIFRATNLASQVIETLGSSKMQDSQKIEMLLRKHADHRNIWKAIEKNREFFSRATEFEGGFTAPAVMKESWTADDLKPSWPGPIAAALRNIRNALSHGKEARMAAVITPTASNLKRLQPWVALIAAVSREIMVYRGVD